MSLGTPHLEQFQRVITPVERFFYLSPYSVVTMLVRVKGQVTESALRQALTRLQQRHPVLRSRVLVDDDGVPWFTSEGAGEISVDILPRELHRNWVPVVQQSCRTPFDFEARPAIRFTLLESPDVCEIIIFCHHLICDGLSLAYLARDLLTCLGDPEGQLEAIPAPAPLDVDTLPADVSMNAITKFFINRVNKKWERERVVFDQEDYRNLTEAYWMHYKHQVLPVELPEDQTRALVDRSRKEGLTVNSALTTAFVGAQSKLLGDQSFLPSLGIAGNLRERLRIPVGEGMGFYAGVISLDFKYNQTLGFWDNARNFHQKFVPLVNNKNLLKDQLNWCYLEPGILEAVNFKKLGGLVPPDFSRHQKLSDFSEREDVILSILKRDKMETLDRVFMGTAITNLGRMNFPRTYGSLELDRLMMKPGGGFPLVNVNLVVGAVTCSGKLSLLIEYVDENIDHDTMLMIKDQALDFLLPEKRNGSSEFEGSMQS